MWMKKWRQHLAAVLANHTTLVAGLVLGWTSPALPELSLTDNEESWVGSLALLGALLGAVPAGCLTDRLGRKRFLLMLSAPFVLGWGLIVAALWVDAKTDVWMLYAGRFICGLAVGATTVAVPLYTNEIAEDKVRGALGVYLDMMLTTGILVVYCLGAAFSCFTLSAVCAAACPLLAIAFAVMPESPTYLLACGRPEKSETALRWLRVRREDDTEIQLELARIRSIVESAHQHGHPKGYPKRGARGANGLHEQGLQGGVVGHLNGHANGHANGTAGSVPLCEKEPASAESAGSATMTASLGASAGDAEPPTTCGRLVDHVTGKTPTGRAFFIVMGLMLFMQLSGIDAVIFYLGEIFQDAGSTLSPLKASIVVGFVQVVANVSSAVLVDRVGRRVLLILSEALMAASLASLALYFHLRDDLGIQVSVNYGWVPVVALSVFVWVFAFGIGSLPWFMMAELLPSEAQDWGSSSAICLNWSLGFLVTNVFGSMVRDMGGAATYGVFCSICVLGTLFMAFMVPETKGRSPDEIQSLLVATSRHAGKTSKV